MKFNQALIAAVATSAMLMSPVFAQSPVTCDGFGRVDASPPATSVTQASDCGVCKPDFCPVTDPSVDLQYTCKAITNAALQKCTSTFGEECIQTFNGKCVDPVAYSAADKACDANAKIHGKALKEDPKDATKTICDCEFGTHKVKDGKGAEVDVCKCADDVKEVRDPATGTCATRPKFDCSTIGRIDGANTAAQFSADACGDCKTATDCKVGKDKNDKAYKCLAPPKDSKCNVPELTITCDGEFTYDPANNVCVAKQAAPPAPGNTTEPPKTETLPEKCKKINRKVDGEKCGACLDNYASLKTDDVASRCYPHADKTKCEDKAKTTKRVFDETLKLCKCPEGMNPSADGKESSIDDVCKSAAGQLVISSIVLLSSVAASALFFL